VLTRSPATGKSTNQPSLVWKSTVSLLLVTIAFAFGAEGLPSPQVPEVSVCWTKVPGYRVGLWGRQRPRAAVIRVDQPVLDGVDRLRLRVPQIVGAEQLSGGHENHRMAGDLAEFRLAGDRLGDAAGVLQGRQALRVVDRRGSTVVGMSPLTSKRQRLPSRSPP
jgi:hypothetical protein